MGAHVPAAGPARPPRLHDPRPRSGPRRGSRCRLDRGRRVARRAARVVVAARSGARLPRRAGRRRGPAGRRSAAVGGRRDHHADRCRRRGEGRRLRADPDGAPGRRGGRGPRRLARDGAGDRGRTRRRTWRPRPAARRATSSPRSGRRSGRAATRSAPRSARRSTSRASRRRDLDRWFLPAESPQRHARPRHVALEPRSAGRRRPRSGQRARRRPVHGDAQRLVLVVPARRRAGRSDARGDPPGADMRRSWLRRRRGRVQRCGAGAGRRGARRPSRDAQPGRRAPRPGAAGDARAGRRSAADATWPRRFVGPAQPFRATLFDKSASANWLVVWHQDTALPMRAQHRRRRLGAVVDEGRHPLRARARVGPGRGRRAARQPRSTHRGQRPAARAAGHARPGRARRRRDRASWRGDGVGGRVHASAPAAWWRCVRWCCTRRRSRRATPVDACCTSSTRLATRFGAGARSRGRDEERDAGAQARLRGTARTSRSRAWRTRLTSVSDVNGFSRRSTLRPSCSPRLPG